MKRIISYLSDLKLSIALTLLLKMVATLTELALPWLLSYMIDTIAPTKNISHVIIIGVIMVVLSFIAVQMHIISNRTTAKISCSAVINLRNDVFTKVYSLSIKQLEDITISSTVSRLTTDTQNVLGMIMMTLRAGVRAPIVLIGGIIFTMVMDFRLSLLLILLLPLIFLVSYFITRKGTTLHGKIQRSGDKLVNVVRDAVSGLLVIKSFATEDFEENRFANASSNLKENELKTAKLMSSLNPAINMILNIGLVLVILIGAILVSKNQSTVGNIIAFLSYFTMFSNAMMAVNRLFTIFARALASSNRINELLDMEIEQPLPKTASKQKESHIEVKNLTFAYTNGKNVLNNISFKLNKGETLGILGATGSGKSTLIQLLQGFYKPTNGEIYINSKNISQQKEEDVHSMFGVVLQNDSIFADTIGNNIRFGRDISGDELQKAMEAAQFSEFVNSQILGTNYQLTASGGNLSGGQKQRLLIARALVGTPEILILDDSSSALDYRTDAIIRRAIKEFARCTTIIVAQRVTSVMSADKILFLSEKGEALAIGTHEEMMKTCTEYRNTWNIQTGGDFC